MDTVPAATPTPAQASAPILIPTPIVPGITDPTITRTSERVAVIESKVNKLDEHSKALRTNVHNLAGSLQHIVIAEEKCAQALTILGAQVTEVRLSSGTHTIQLDDVHKKLDEMRLAKSRFEGVIRGIFIYTGVLVAVVGGVAWVLEHLDIHLGVK